MLNLWIFASGSGSNWESIVTKLKNSDVIRVSNIYTDVPDAWVIERANRLDIPCEVFNANPKIAELNDMINWKLLEILKRDKIDYIALAWFLPKVPKVLIDDFTHTIIADEIERIKTNIINIHPWILPWWGKGKYWLGVHKAALEYLNDHPEIFKMSGLTIHEINENWDDWKILFQKWVSVFENDTPEILQKRVLKDEHRYFAPVIEEHAENDWKINYISVCDRAEDMEWRI